MEKSAVFEQTYRHYLKKIAQTDYLARADLLGAEVQDSRLIISLYDRRYAVSDSAIEGLDQTPANDAIRVILSKYVLSCPDEMPALANRWVTYRDFKDAAPLVSSFTANTNKNIESHFSGKLDQLKQRCADIGGVVENNESYDLSVRFYALPRIPVILNFNDADDLFPAACSILYQESAQHFLDMECLAITGTLLTGKLLKATLEK